MMMTSGETVKYQGSLNCLFQIIRNEGVTALFKGFTVNILRIIVGAQVLAGLDKLVQLYSNIQVDAIDSGYQWSSRSDSPPLSVYFQTPFHFSIAEENKNVEFSDYFILQRTFLPKLKRIFFVHSYVRRETF